MEDQDLTLNEDQLLDDTIDEDEAKLLNEEDYNMDPELEAIKARVKEMEEEAEKIKQMQDEVDKQMILTSPITSISSAVPVSFQEKEEIDSRSIYVGNVDYGATAGDLESHFKGCGTVNRITILCNKADGHPKGFAYIEFASKEFVDIALAMNDTLFKGRQIKVMAKRTNRPGISTTNRYPRGFRGRVATGTTRIPRAYSHAGYRGAVRAYPLTRGYRGRVAYNYAPY